MQSHYTAGKLITFQWLPGNSLRTNLKQLMLLKLLRSSANAGNFGDRAVPGSFVPT